MVERRKFPRGYRTYQCRFGLQHPEYDGQARRISIGGLFISNNKTVYAVGVPVVVEITIGDQVFSAIGVVKHSLRVDPRMIRLMRPGMGIEFTEANEELRRAIAESEKFTSS